MIWELKPTKGRPKIKDFIYDRIGSETVIPNETNVFRYITILAKYELKKDYKELTIIKKTKCTFEAKIDKELDLVITAVKATDELMFRTYYIIRYNKKYYICSNSKYDNLLMKFILDHRARVNEIS